MHSALLLFRKSTSLIPFVLFCNLVSEIRTPEGDKFVIKDPERFANEVIPQYFDHNKVQTFEVLNEGATSLHLLLSCPLTLRVRTHLFDHHLSSRASRDS